MDRKIKINKDDLVKIGFTYHKGLIQDSFSYTIEDHKSHDDILNTEFFHFKQLSLALCNDFGKGEYYVFVREGYSDKRHEDDIVTLNKNYIFMYQVQNLLDCLLVKI